MKVQSIRYGFATNSSSSHSVVLYHKPARRIEDVLEELKVPGTGKTEFGWEEELSTDVKSILNYGIIFYLLPHAPFNSLVESARKPAKHPLYGYKISIVDRAELHKALELLVRRRKIRPETQRVVVAFPWEQSYYIDHQSGPREARHDVTGKTPEQRFWDFVTRCLSIQTDNDNK